MIVTTNLPVKSAMSNVRPRFEKGVSGNPAGRPKLTEAEKDIRKAARKYADDALNVLVKALEYINGSPEERAVAVSAAKDLLDRGFGKATQHTTAEVSVTHYDARERLQRKLHAIIDAEAKDITAETVN